MPRKTLSTTFETIIGFWNRDKSSKVSGEMLSTRKTDSNWYILLKCGDKKLNVMNRGEETVAKEGDVVGLSGSKALECLQELPRGTKVWIEYLGKRDNDKTGRSFLEYKIEADIPDSD